MTCTTPPSRAAARLNSGVRCANRFVGEEQPQRGIAWLFASTATAFLDPHSAAFHSCADKFMVNAHLPHQNCAPCALLQRITSPNERAVPRACHIRNDCGNLGSSNRVVLPFVKDGAHLTIRSSRDRFAARLTRYRVPQRRAATQSGLTQVLGLQEQTCASQRSKLFQRVRCVVATPGTSSDRSGGGRQLTVRPPHTASVQAQERLVSDPSEPDIRKPNYSFKPTPLRSFSFAPALR